MTRALHRVFLSHTSELRTFPSYPRSFAEAAERGVVRFGSVATDMEYFTSRSQQVADYCRVKVRENDVYLGILGFRYGSAVRDEPDVSYTEMEFDEATTREMPRLVFLLSEDAELPLRLVDQDRTRQSQFREKVRAQGGVVTTTFRTADELELKVYQALVELLADSGVNPNLDDDVPWMTPATWTTFIPRPELYNSLIQKLTDSTTHQVAVTAGVHGAGGFGKTTLAAEVSRSEAVRKRFPDGLLWTTLGEQANGLMLAEKINDLTEIVTGRRPTLSDPEQAGRKLGAALRHRTCLIVVDDAWLREQVTAFLHDAPNCTRLVTTRIRGILPLDSDEIEVDVMEVDEARTLLSSGLSGLSDHRLNQLVRITGRWPVLLRLVNSAIRKLTRRGLSADEATDRIAHRLLAGPTALDVQRPQDRHEAVAATVEASLEVLTPEQLDRYVELAIFPEDVMVPLEALKLWWSRYGVDARAVEQLCDEFADLSLLQTYQVQPEAVVLHDVVRGYLRSRCGSEHLRVLNDQFVQAVGRDMGFKGELAWWELPDHHEYLWSYLPFHLGEAGRVGEQRQLVSDLRWVCSKLERLGPVETEADLALSDAPEAVELRREIGRSAHLLTPITPRQSLSDILLSRLYGIASLESAVTEYEQNHAPPRLRPLRPLPDWPHPALRRIMSAQEGRVLACAAGFDGEVLLGGGVDQKLRLWDVETGVVRRVMSGHDGPIWSCAMSPDGSWAVSAGDDTTVRIWDLHTSKNIDVLRHHSGPVRACVIDPGGAWVASGGDDQSVQIWLRDTRTVNFVLRGHEGIIRSLAVSPDGTWLASGGDDFTVQIWDVATGLRRHVLYGHSDSIWALVAGPGGAWLASEGLDRTVRLWSPVTGEEIRCLQTPSGAALAYGVTEQMAWLATGGDEGTIQVWDLENGELRGTLNGHVGRVRSCAADPHGRWLATAADDHTVRTWDMLAVEHNDPRGSDGPVWTCSADRSLGIVATAGADRAVRLWRPAPGQADILERLPMQPWSSAVSPDGDRVAAATQDGRLWLWDIASGSAVDRIAAHRGPVWNSVFSRDGRRLLTAGEDRYVRMWSLDAARLTLLDQYRHAHAVRTCAFGPDDAWFTAAGDGGFIRLTDVASGEVHREWDSHQGRVWTCVAAQGTNMIMTGGDDGTVRRWSTDGQQRAVWSGHRQRVCGCSLNPAETALASVSADQTLRVWEIASGRCLAAMRVGQPFAACCWLPDGHTIYLAGGGGIYTFRVRV